MFGKKKLPPIRSLIAEGSHIQGDMSFGDGLRIDGSVHGDIRAHEERPSILVISETAKVLGEVRADHVVINGSIRGPVHARVMLELQPKARIEGDIHYASLEMHQGAIVAGQLLPTALAEEKPALKLAASNA